MIKLMLEFAVSGILYTAGTNKLIFHFIMVNQSMLNVSKTVNSQVLKILCSNDIFFLNKTITHM